MNKIVALVFLYLSTPHVSQADTPHSFAAVPMVIRANLDRRFPGWHLAVPSDDQSRWLIPKHARSVEGLCIAKADLDGNGANDYALFIQTGTTGTDTRLVVFLRRGQGYRHQTLDVGEPAGEMWLLVARPGTRDYNYTDDRYLTYRRPTLMLCSEKGGYSYLYARGRFRRIISSD